MCCLLFFCGVLLVSFCVWVELVQVCLFSSDFVFLGKYQCLVGWVCEVGVELCGLCFGIGEVLFGEWLDGGNLLIFDMLWLIDCVQVEEVLGECL